MVGVACVVLRAVRLICWMPDWLGLFVVCGVSSSVLHSLWLLSSASMTCSAQTVTSLYCHAQNLCGRIWDDVELSDNGVSWAWVEISSWDGGELQATLASIGCQLIICFTSGIPLNVQMLSTLTLTSSLSESIVIGCADVPSPLSGSNKWRLSSLLFLS